MNIVFKRAATAALLGVVALASATPGEARSRWVAPAAAGFAAGALVGGAAASAYGPGYYRPGYAYGSGYDAYASAGSFYAAPGYYRGSSITSSPGCTTEGNYGQGIDESACNQ